MKNLAEPASDPSYHGEHVQAMLTELIDHCHDDLGHVTDPRFQALLETTAKVLRGIRSVFEQYARSEEPPTENPESD